MWSGDTGKRGGGHGGTGKKTKGGANGSAGVGTRGVGTMNARKTIPLFLPLGLLAGACDPSPETTLVQEDRRAAMEDVILAVDEALPGAEAPLDEVTADGQPKLCNWDQYVQVLDPKACQESAAEICITSSWVETVKQQNLACLADPTCDQYIWFYWTKDGQPWTTPMYPDTADCIEPTEAGSYKPVVAVGPSPQLANTQHGGCFHNQIQIGWKSAGECFDFGCNINVHIPYSTPVGPWGPGWTAVDFDPDVYTDGRNVDYLWSYGPGCHPASHYEPSNNIPEPDFVTPDMGCTCYQTLVVRDKNNYACNDSATWSYPGACPPNIGGAFSGPG